MTEPTMETLTDLEKQALSEAMEHYIHHLYTCNGAEASIKFYFYEELRDKLDLILFPPLYGCDD